jgi:flagellar biosynthetic protein FliR
MDHMAFTLWGTFLLVLARVTGFFVQAPIFGSHHIAKPVLAGIAILCSILIFPYVEVPSDFPESMLFLGYMLVGQFSIGAVIGFVAFIVMAIAQFAGEMLDIQMGLSVAASFDPASHGAVNLLRRLHFYIAMTLFLMLDGHHYMLRCVFKSFDLIPVTKVWISGALVNELIRLSGTVFYLGIQMAAPALAALFITQVALGMIARTAPQMNVFMLSFPLNIAIGLTLLGLSLPLINMMMRHLFMVNSEDLIRTINILSTPLK